MSNESRRIPAKEGGRVDALRRYEILDTPPDGAFDQITAMAAKRFSTAISIISLVDTDRIWFKSHHGFDIDEIGRDPGLCVIDAEPRAVSEDQIAYLKGLASLVMDQMKLRLSARRAFTDLSTALGQSRQSYLTRHRILVVPLEALGF